MTKLPEEFVLETRRLMGEERFNRYLDAFNEEAPTSIRLNPRISQGVKRGHLAADLSPCEVPWCEEGYYLKGPAVTMYRRHHRCSSVTYCAILSRSPLTCSTSVQPLVENRLLPEVCCPQEVHLSATNRYQPERRSSWKTSRNGAGPARWSPTTIPVISD